MLDGTPILRRLSERELSRLRSSRLSMVFQDPMTSLNPAYTIGNQMIEVYRPPQARRLRRSHKARAVFLLCLDVWASPIP